MTDTVQTEPPKKPKKQYAKANITNSADKLIRKELDDADGVLEKVIHKDSLPKFQLFLVINLLE